MSEAVPKSVYIVGSLIGIPALILAMTLVPGFDSAIVSALQLGAMFAVFGLTAGLVRPAGRWHWGVALAIPLILFLGMSVAFAGQLQAFLIHDAPLVLGVLAGGTLGGQLGSWLRRRGRRSATPTP
jgi:hypothetical protein